MVACRACPRLVAWREEVARRKRAAFRDQEYWGRPVPGFGDPRARLLIVGLAPAAHGGNRTGRIFTGDRSGDFLFAALWRAGLASQPTSVARGDGLALRECFVTAAVRCCPPANRPLPGELARCAPFLEREIEALPGLRAALALGAVAFEATVAATARLAAAPPPRPRPRFAHGAVWRGPLFPVVASYHPSQQNTQTGKLTPAMFDEAIERARALAFGG